METLTCQATNSHLSKFLAMHPESGNDILSILEWGGDAVPDRLFYSPAVSAELYYETSSIDEKLRIEISRWSAALESAELAGDCSSLRRLSVALQDVWKTQEPKEAALVFGRTRRMLQLLAAILLPESACGSNPYRDAVVRLRAAVPETKDIVDALKRLHRPVGDGSQWHVSLVLLLVAAVGESQCEYLQPCAWEAYSAGRAREDLRGRWKGLPEQWLSVVALLVRCQSAVGQFCRDSGGEGFNKLGDAVARACGFGPEDLRKALQLLAVVEEARNHCAPVNPTNLDQGLNAGVVWVWNQEEFELRSGDYLRYQPGSRYRPTFSYFQPRYLGFNQAAGCSPELILRVAAALEEFRETVRTRMEKPHPHEEFVSLTRFQTRGPLQELLRAAICGVDPRVAPENIEPGMVAWDPDRFDRYFRLQPLKVPHALMNRRAEMVIEVKLREGLAAECLLFPAGEWRPHEPEPNGATPSAGQIFLDLVGKAVEVLGLKDDTAWDEPTGNKGGIGSGGVYFSYALIRRITEVVHTVLPGSCFRLPLRFDDAALEWISIPSGIPTTDARARRLIANYVVARLVNRAMGPGIRSVELDLKTMAVSAKRQGGGGQTMQPADWQTDIEKAYRGRGACDILLEDYLRGYNAQREIVHFETKLLAGRAAEERGNLPAGTDAFARVAGVPVGEVNAHLAYLSRPQSAQTARRPDVLAAAVGATVSGVIAEPERPPLRDAGAVLVGIDIGGTETKAQVFGPGDNRFVPICEVMKMKTAPAPEKLDALKKAVQRAELHAGAELFARRLFEEVAWPEELESVNPARVVIGISWPGPVRDNRIAGTSQPLLNFGSFSGSIPNNRIEDIWEVDIAGAVRQAWKKRFGTPNGGVPSVTLLNDGDADATGALVTRGEATSRYSGYHRPVLSVVKIGTGLAGAVFEMRDGKWVLRTGPYEWGKLITDVGAPFREAFRYPQGVANEYLSKRALARLARYFGRANHCFQADDPGGDAAEIGLLAALDEACAADKAQSFENLLVMSGALQCESVLSPRVPARAFLDVQAGTAHPNFRHLVKLALPDYKGSRIQLVDRLRSFGLARLEHLLGSHDDLPDTPAAFLSHEAVKTAVEVARKSIQVLGHYLGDFCLLLHSDFSVEELILTGGILSGTTRKLTLEAAMERVKSYGLEMAPLAEEESYWIGEPPVPAAMVDSAAPPTTAGTAKSQRGINVERGAYGAACYAAVALMEKRREDGLQVLRSSLLILRPGQTVTVAGSTVKFGEQREENLREYALGEELLLGFLREHGPALRLFQQADNEKGFVRW